MIVAACSVEGRLGSSAGSLNASPTIGDFVLYAQKAVKIGTYDLISGGDIGVHMRASDSFGAQMIVGDHSSIDAGRNLVAPSIALGPHAKVGDTQTDQLTLDSGAKAGALSPFPSNTPFIPLAFTGTSGSDVNVGTNQTTTLMPGEYGALNIGSHSTVSLSAGAYSFSTVSIGDHVTISAVGNGAELRIRGALSIDEYSTVTPAKGGTADNLRIWVFGNDDPDNGTPATRVGSHANITATIASPHGTLALGDYVAATGAFAAFVATIGDHTTVTFQAGLSTSPQGQQLLGDAVRQPAFRAAVDVPIPSSTILSLAFGLPIQNRQLLDAIVATVSDPASPNYQKYLTPTQFTAAFGPPPSDYQSLVNWALAHGFTTDQRVDRIVLVGQATVADIEQALFVNLDYGLREDGSQFIQPDREPSLDLAVGLQSLQGLDDLVPTVPVAGSGPNGLYQGQDFRVAYASCKPGLTGFGQRVSVLSANEGFTPSDVAQYIQQAGLSQFQPNPIETVVLDGICDNQGQSCKASGGVVSGLSGRSVETAGDIEWLLSMAPQAQIVFVNGTHANSLLSRVADDSQDPLSSVVTSSWVFSVVNTTTADLTLKLAAQGQSFFEGSGDSRAWELNDTPDGLLCFDKLTGQASSTAPALYAFMPGATIVGGTMLTMNGNGVSYVSETTWPKGGGGVLGKPNNAPIPSYQLTVEQANSGNGGSTLFRNIPDVSMVAESVFSIGSECQFVCGPKGHQTCCKDDNGNPFIATGVQKGNGGTSISTPLWAGFTALVNQANQQRGLGPVGFINPLLYRIAPLPSYSSVFNDIQDFSTNTNTCNNGFSAVQGYDLATGLGSPQCALIDLIGTLAGPPAVKIMLVDPFFATSGGNVLNCEHPAQPATEQTVTPTTFTCTPTRNGDGSISTTPVGVTGRVGCGDGHGAFVAITCFGTGTVGDVSISATVTISITSSCGTLATNTANADGPTTFTGVLPGAPQTSSTPLDSCDVFSNACATGAFCEFNEFRSSIKVENTGGF